MNEDELILAQRLNLETARIPWHALQTHFASGSVIAVAAGLDIIGVAEALARDNTEQFKEWLESEQVAPVSDAQAQAWFEGNTELWALVIKPWVLVQEPSEPAH